MTIPTFAFALQLGEVLSVQSAPLLACALRPPSRVREHPTDLVLSNPCLAVWKKYPSLDWGWMYDDLRLPLLSLLDGRGTRRLTDACLAQWCVATVGREFND